MKMGQHADARSSVIVVVGLAVRAHANVAVANPSFEGSTGWTALTTGSEEFWAAPGGTAYASHLAGAPGDRGASLANGHLRHPATRASDTSGIG